MVCSGSKRAGANTSLLPAVIEVHTVLCRPATWNRGGAGDVEQTLAAGEHPEQEVVKNALHLRDRAAVGGDARLRPAGRARGVEQHERIVLVDRRRRRIAPTLQQRFDRQCAVRRVAADVEDLLEVLDRVDHRRHALVQVLVHDQVTAARVAQAVRDLLAVPPAVQADGDRAGRGRAEQRDQPLGTVERQDADAVALLEAVLLDQRVRGAPDELAELAVAEAAFAVDEEFLVAVREHRVVHLLAHRTLALLEHAQGSAPYILDHDFQHSAGRLEQGARLLVLHAASTTRGQGYAIAPLAVKTIGRRKRAV
jgi:hypothetical protein